MTRTLLARLAGAALATAAMLAPATAQEKLTVLLDWFVNPDHAPLVIAQEGGFFERLGLEVEMIAPADPSAPPKLVAAGQADIAISYQPDLMVHLNEGLPLVRFGTLVETPLNTLIVLEDGPVETLLDLKGKKIGYAVAGFSEAYIRTILNSVELSIDDVELINVNFNLSPSLMAGQVDAIVGGYRNFELNQLDIEGRPGRAFYLEEHGVPIYDELIYITRSELRDDPRLATFLRAVEQATVFLTNHPDEALEMFLKAHPDLDDELNRRAWADTLPRFAKRPAALDVGRYQRFAQFMKAEGLLDAVPEVASYAVAPQ